MEVFHAFSVNNPGVLFKNVKSDKRGEKSIKSTVPREKKEMHELAKRLDTLGKKLIAEIKEEELPCGEVLAEKSLQWRFTSRVIQKRSHRV